MKYLRFLLFLPVLASTPEVPNTLPDPFTVECALFCAPEVLSGVYGVSWANVCECRDGRVLKKVL